MDTAATDNIKIDAEFAALIPPLSAEERQQLEENIVEHGGARDPLVVWVHDNWIPDGCEAPLAFEKPSGALHGEFSGEPFWDADDGETYFKEHWPKTLLDGHNRYEICTRLRLAFDVHELRFKSREEAADWIDKNQLGRRNLDARQMSLLRGRRYNRTKKPGRPSEQPGQNVRVSAESLALEHGVNEKTIRRDGEFAEAVEALGIEREIVAGEIDAPKHEIVAAAKSLPDDATSDDVAQAVEAVKSRPHVANNSGDNEWYTPQDYIEAARQVLHEIHLDPASNPIANEVVKAETFYTAQNDGLSKEWEGNVWMNPPYESGLIGRFVEKLCDSYLNGDVPRAVVLVNNATETKWFQALASEASAICFPRGRVKFWHPRKVAFPLQGQAVLFLGREVDDFIEAFSSFGFCMEVSK